MTASVRALEGPVLNFRQRFWRPAWDGIDTNNPSSTRHLPAILSGFRFHEGRHTHATLLTEDGIS